MNQARSHFAIPLVLLVNLLSFRAVATATAYDKPNIVYISEMNRKLCRMPKLNSDI